MGSRTNDGNDIYWQLYCLIILGLIIAIVCTAPDLLFEMLRSETSRTQILANAVGFVLTLSPFKRNFLVWVIYLLCEGILVPSWRQWALITAGLVALIGVFKITDFGNSAFGKAFILMLFAVWYAWSHGYLH